MSKKKKINKTRSIKSEDFETDLYNFIATKPERGVALKQIVKWSLKQNDGAGLFDSIEKMVDQKRIEEVEQDKFRIKPTFSPEDTLIGIVDITRSGNAYVIIDGKLNDIFIPSRSTNRAFNGDVVRVRLTRKSKSQKQEGEIVEVIKRQKETFIGHIQINNDFAFVVTDKEFNNYDFYITPDEVKRSKVSDGERVIVRLKDWPPNMKNPIGQIVDKLKPAGDHESDMRVIMVETGINYNFPEEVEKEAAAISENISEEVIAKRRDIRNTWTITIDPHDAKDFDDAISLRKLENGNTEVGVHIADVSHFVTVGSQLDKEAYQRATSVYLVDRVIPMLPEKLSNNVCSLVPHKDRLTFSAIFEFNDKHEIVDTWFGKTVIHSDRRFSYEEAQEIIENKTGEFAEEILQLNVIAHKLRDEKFKNGAIAFETQEVKFILDENKVPIGLYVKDRKEAHMLIEDLMLLANRKVAEFMGKTSKGKAPEGKQDNTNYPFVYRVHDVPDIQRLEEFGLTAKRFGYKLKLDSPQNISSELNKLMKEVQGKPEQNVLEQMAIRCMAKAVYTSNNIGHYGLAFNYYTHFTSPIRRYPDLLVHRILFAALHHSNKPISKNDLEEKCRYASAQERTAMQAERESVKYKQVEYLSKHIGEVFEGIISGVTHFGIFVELRENKCEGMVAVNSIRDEMTFDDKRRRLVSLTGNKPFEMGDVVKVKVVKADLDARRLDFVFV
ncbi:MAG: ribonuclease R [Chitinophagales bacterium]|nr:ribonuclease R [Bacteroidota bacterium]